MRGNHGVDDTNRQDSDAVTDAATNPDTPAPAAIPTPDIDAATVAKKTRGRPPKSSAPETPQQRIDRLKAELVKAEEAKKELEQQRDAIVGKVVVAHALANPDYRRQLAALLKAQVKGKAELAAIAELLA
jgi:hypothetical protein